MKTFFIKTLGCKTNQLESAIIEEKLINANYKKVDEIKDCQIFILNSCTVTHSTDNDAIKLINSVKNLNPNIFVVLTGCFAQLQANELEKNPKIDLILGNNDKFEIAEHLKNDEKCAVTDIMKVKDFYFQPVHDLSRTRANLKIQDGCNNRCAYCTIPFARGFSRSNSIENIISQIEMLEKNNFKEIILTGIHIGQWGMDFTPSKTLLNLLEEIEQTKIERYRLGSLNPLEINDDLLNFLKNSDKFCPHFHLSLQNANDKILNLMNRKYTFDFYYEQIQKINDMFNLPFLGADIIVGFPNETKEDFEVTKQNLEKSGLSKIHVFPYSKRLGTTAFDMENQVEESEKKHRAKILQNVSNELYNKFLEKNIGQISEVMIEKHANEDGFLKGLTRNYLNVVLNNKDCRLTNTLQKVKLTGICNNKMTGEILQK